MVYGNIEKAVFIERPNRFIAMCETEKGVERVHVKNTGRCMELLVPGAQVYLQRFDTEKRSTALDLISVYKGDRLINMDSQAPNKVFHEWAASGGFTADVDCIKPECRRGDSRFDFYMEAGGRKIFVEVKGVTLEEDGVAMFPDAPTERGLKHVSGLEEAVREGFDAYVFFVIQMQKIKYFTPNAATHKAFAEKLKEASVNGVRILAYDCLVTENSLCVNSRVPVIL